MTIWSPSRLAPGKPKYLALAEAIAADIGAGALRPGDRLPTHRDLADALGLNVSTVSRAYREAAHRGLTCGTVGRGTFVAADAGTSSSLTPLEGQAGTGPLDMGLVTPLYYLDPDLGKAMGRLAKERDLSAFMRYGAPDGMAEHKRAGAAWARRYGLEAPPERVMVFSGVQHGLACCLLALFKPGQGLAVEELTYPGLKSPAAAAGLRLVPVAMDGQGMVPEALETACRRGEVKGLYLMPSVQNPTTACMSQQRREALAQVIRHRGLILLEDDAYGLTRPDAPPPLAGLVPEQAVFFAGVSKVFWAGLRVSFAVVPEAFRLPLTEAALGTVWMSPPLNAALAAQCIEGGQADETVAAKRVEAARRCAAARGILGRHGLGCPEQGYFMWLALPEPWTSRAFEDAALRSGVRVFGADKFAVGGSPPRAAARVSLTGPDTLEDLRRGLAVLAGLLKNAAPPPEAIL